MRRSNNRAEQAKRPKSALSSRVTGHGRLRLDDNQQLNSIRNDINRTFSGQNKLLKQLRQLTTTKIGERYLNRIDRLCVQFSICQNPKRQKKLSADIDVDFIAKKFINTKSKQKQKEVNKSSLKKTVGIVSRRYMKEEPQQFFKFDHQTLRQMQQKERRKSNSKGNRKEHPYLRIYQQSQVEALANLTDKNELNLCEANQVPVMAQPEEWQKQQKQMKQIYNVIRSTRMQTARKNLRKTDNGDIDNFYIT